MMVVSLPVAALGRGFGESASRTAEMTASATTIWPSPWVPATEMPKTDAHGPTEPMTIATSAPIWERYTVTSRATRSSATAAAATGAVGAAGGSGGGGGWEMLMRSYRSERGKL